MRRISTSAQSSDFKVPKIEVTCSFLGVLGFIGLFRVYRVHGVLGFTVYRVHRVLRFIGCRGLGFRVKFTVQGLGFRNL